MYLGRTKVRKQLEKMEQEKADKTLKATVRKAVESLEQQWKMKEQLFEIRISQSLSVRMSTRVLHRQSILIPSNDIKIIYSSKKYTYLYIKCCDQG